MLPQRDKPRDNLARHKDAIRRALLPPLTAVAGLALLLVLQVATLVSELHRVDASSQVVARADRLQRLLIDMETGQRGYLVGGDSRFLQPYHTARKAIVPAFDDLDRSIAPQPTQRRRVATIRIAYKQWAGVAESEMAVRDRGGSAYIADFNRARGKAQMDGLRHLIDDLIAEERMTRRGRLADAQYQSRALLYFAGFATLAIGGLLAWTTRRAVASISEEYERALSAEQVARDSLGATLTSIGDGVLVANAAGRVTMLNPVAEALTGWSNADAVGKDSRVILDLVDSETREVVASPVERVLRAGQFVGLGGSTVLRRRGLAGEIPIDNSGAPIHDTRFGGKDSLSGVVLVFRDVSERKRQEAALAEAAARTSRIAETLQQSLLLTPDPRQFAGLEIATRYQAASREAQLGGDFFDVFALGERQVAVVVGDVTGKGLAAAAFTAEAKFALRTMLREQPDPATALLRLNRFLIDSHELDGRDYTPLIALTLAVIDTGTGDVIAAAAGAEPPLIVPGVPGTPSVWIDASGSLIGMDPTGDYIGVASRMEIGDHLLLMTDGITEARQGRVFLGAEGVVRHVDGCPRESAAGVADSLLGAVREYGGERFRDDVCLVVVRRTGFEDRLG